MKFNEFKRKIHETGSVTNTRIFQIDDLRGAVVSVLTWLQSVEAQFCVSDVVENQSADDLI
jgi:hypothetical protein